jgi:hypothetical protein
MNEIATAIAAAFDKSEVKQRPGRGGKQFSYIDARVVGRRLTEVLGLAGWDFQATVADADRQVVHGRLTVRIEGQTIVREDFGYPNTPDSDEEPLKSAASDALKRCAVQLGVGAYLYGGATPKPMVSQADKQQIAKYAEKFEMAVEAIRMIDAARAQKIEDGISRLGVNSFMELPVKKAEWATERALTIMDEVFAAANQADQEAA